MGKKRKQNEKFFIKPEIIDEKSKKFWKGMIWFNMSFILIIKKYNYILKTKKIKGKNNNIILITRHFKNYRLNVLLL